MDRVPYRRTVALKGRLTVLVDDETNSALSMARDCGIDVPELVRCALKHHVLPAIDAAIKSNPPKDSSQ